MKLLAETSDLRRLNHEMRRFAEATGKSMENVLAYEAKEVGWGLYRESRKLSPRPQKILDEANTRSWRMGRRGNALTPARFGISAAALRRAESLMGGEKSDFFKVTTNGEGMLQIRRVRFSARRETRNRTRLSRVLRGGRFGNKFAAGSLRGSQVSKFELGQALRTNQEIKRLNLGAVSAAVEVGLRQRAAKGGTVATQWLPRVWRRSKSSVVKSGPLVVNSRAGFEMGRVTFETDRNLLSAVNIAGNVPGTSQVFDRHGTLSKVLALRIADRQRRTAAALAKAKAESFRSN